MDRNFLLTYEVEEDNKTKFEYGWFGTEKDMKDFIEDHNVMVITAIEINDYKNINLKEGK